MQNAFKNLNVSPHLITKFDKSNTKEPQQQWKDKFIFARQDINLNSSQRESSSAKVL